MSGPAYAVGQAIFIRTDTLDYAEESVPFKNLEELVRICSEPRENLTLDKIVVYSMFSGEPAAVTLGFVSASKGQRPRNLEYLDQ
jgi:hypothetical protein